jgi:hypothetical protein
MHDESINSDPEDDLKMVNLMNGDKSLRGTLVEVA